MNKLRWIVLGVLGLCASASLDVQAGGYGHYYARQYYSGWNHYNYGSSDYYYRSYYYKPYDDYYGYRHHYCIYVPSDPDYCYFYNPYKQCYWGRCPSHCDGQPQYSLLAESDRAANLADIPPSAFPKPGPMPNIPEAKDGVKMDLPPDDLPKADTLPKAARTPGPG